MDALISNFIVIQIEKCERLNEIETMNSIRMVKLTKSHGVVSQCFTKVLRALRIDFIVRDDELFECLYKTETMKLTKSYRLE